MRSKEKVKVESECFCLIYQGRKTFGTLYLTKLARQILYYENLTFRVTPLLELHE